jgi:hypothetical protein
MKEEDAKITKTEEEVNEPVPEKKVKETKTNKKSHKLLFSILAVVAVLILIPVFIAGWLGFVPGLSNILGANNPRDLGVVYTEADYNSYLEKTGADFIDFSEAPVNPNNPDKKVIFADPKTVTNQEFTQEELTAAINSVGWAWMPLKNAQVKFTDDTVEVSGNLNIENIDKFIAFIGGVGYSNEDVDTAISWGKRLVGEAPVYIKANASVVNDQLTFNLQEAQIGRYTLPSDISSKVLSTGTTNAVVRADDFEATLAQPVDGALLFSGTYPTTVYVRY